MVAVVLLQRGWSISISISHHVHVEATLRCQKGMLSWNAAPKMSPEGDLCWEHAALSSAPLPPRHEVMKSLMDLKSSQSLKLLHDRLGTGWFQTAMQVVLSLGPPASLHPTAH